MMYLVAAHSGFLIAAAFLGFGMGWIAVVQRTKAVSRTQGAGIGVLVAILLGLALSRVVPGRAGYWLDLGLALFVAYLAGCAVGSWLRDRVVARHAASA